MVAGFAHSLRHSLAKLNLNARIVDQLESNAGKLGSLDAPPGADSRAADDIRTAIADAFVFSFRLITLLCTALAVASALVAWWKIPPQLSH